MKESDFMQYLTIKEWRNYKSIQTVILKTDLCNLFTEYCVKDSCLASVNKWLV